jgi:hypothetical protein
MGPNREARVVQAEMTPIVSTRRCDNKIANLKTRKRSMQVRRDYKRYFDARTVIAMPKLCTANTLRAQVKLDCVAENMRVYLVFWPLPL